MIRQIVVSVRAGRELPPSLPARFISCYHQCMASSIRDNKKPRGRPVTTGTSPLIGVRLPSDLLDALDRFIAQEQPGISRPEALRLVFRDWAIGHGYLDNPPPKEDAN